MILLAAKVDEVSPKLAHRFVAIEVPIELAHDLDELGPGEAARLEAWLLEDLELAVGCARSAAALRGART